MPTYIEKTKYLRVHKLFDAKTFLNKQNKTTIVFFLFLIKMSASKQQFLLPRLRNRLRSKQTPDKKFRYLNSMKHPNLDLLLNYFNSEKICQKVSGSFVSQERFWWCLKDFRLERTERRGNDCETRALLKKNLQKTASEKRKSHVSKYETNDN